MAAFTGGARVEVACATTQGGRIASSSSRAHSRLGLSRPAPQPARRRGLARLAAVVDDEDLWQYADRDQWYLPKWAANDQPDWNAARFVRSTQLAPGVREVVLEVEVSRERVPLRNAYKHAGQRISVRINSGAELSAPVSSPPFSAALLRDGLLKLRNDSCAYETKVYVEEASVMAQVALYATEAEHPDLYKASDQDVVEGGPFTGSGLDLRGPIAGIFVCPTIVIFAEGAGIAAARALVESQPDTGALSFALRRDVRLYYRAPNQGSLCYRGLFERWESEHGVKVVTSTRGSFSDMFDDDETLMYEPESTAAIILTGGDEESEEAALEVCREAEITEVVRQSRPPPPTVYLTSGKNL